MRNPFSPSPEGAAGAVPLAVSALTGPGERALDLLAVHPTSDPAFAKGVTL
jgi:hypothetical protein